MGARTTSGQRGESAAAGRATSVDDSSTTAGTSDTHRPRRIAVDGQVEPDDSELPVQAGQVVETGQTLAVIE